MLPADVLRFMVKDWPVDEIFELCLVNRQFNSALCEDETFWRNLARERGLDLGPSEGSIETISLHDLKRGLWYQENQPYIYNLRTSEYNFNQRDLFSGYDDDDEDYIRVRPLVDLLNYIQMKYNEYYNSLEPEDVEDIPTPTEFEETLHRIVMKLKDGDILDLNIPNSDTPEDFFYVFPLSDGQLYVAPVEIPLNAYIYFPPESIRLFQKLYNRIRRPLTRRDVHGLYLDLAEGYGIIDEANNRLMTFGKEDDPIEDFEGLPLHVKWEKEDSD